MAVLVIVSVNTVNIDRVLDDGGTEDLVRTGQRERTDRGNKNNEEKNVLHNDIDLLTVLHYSFEVCFTLPEYKLIRTFKGSFNFNPWIRTY